MSYIKCCNMLIDGGPEGFQWFRSETKTEKMENNEITADWARKTAQSILGEKVRKEVDVCLNGIKKAVEQNKLSTTIAIYVDDLTKKELENRGFIVNKYSDQRDGSYTTISW